VSRICVGRGDDARATGGGTRFVSSQHSMPSLSMQRRFALPCSDLNDKGVIIEAMGEALKLEHSPLAT
jgi:hypothetical protein